jgi:hypothetical protein
MILAATLSGLLFGFLSAAGPPPDGAQDVLFVATSSSLACGIASLLERYRTNWRIKFAPAVTAECTTWFRPLVRRRSAMRS